jgi:hypothetical protein
MKNKVIPFAFGVFVTLLLAFSTLNYEVRKSTAEVDMISGFYVFSDSKPVSEFDFLGSVKGQSMSMNPQYTNIRDGILKRVKKEYPDANGVILHLNSGGTDRADAIKIK